MVLPSMNTRLLVPFALCALLLASCTSTVARRIEKNPEVFNALSDRQKALVQRGRIDEGMGKDAVWLAWGSANRIATGSHEGRTYERWSYTGYEPVFGTTIGFGVGGGYWGRAAPFIGDGCFADSYYYQEPTLSYVPYEARRVEFTAGRVSAWMAGR